MTPQLRNLLILLGAIAVILLLVMILFSGKSPLMKIFSFFFEETDEAAGRGSRRRNEASDQKKTSEPIVEMATLIRKTDDRLRVIEKDGKERIADEYFELEFITRKGKKLRIECSPYAYGKVPFDKQGSLTYKRNTLVKFKFYEGIVYNEEHGGANG